MNHPKIPNFRPYHFPENAAHRLKCWGQMYGIVRKQDEGTEDFRVRILTKRREHMR